MTLRYCQALKIRLFHCYSAPFLNRVTITQIMIWEEGLEYREVANLSEGLSNLVLSLILILEELPLTSNVNDRSWGLEHLAYWSCDDPLFILVLGDYLF